MSVSYIPPIDIAEMVDVIRECPVCAVAAAFLILFSLVVFWFVVN